MAGKIRLILADNQKLFADSLKVILEQSNMGFEIINVVHDIAGLLKAIQINSPDMLILDISLPGANVPEAIKFLKKKLPRLKIVILCDRIDLLSLRESLKNGTSAYFLKSMPLSELVTLLPVISNNVVILPQGMLGKALDDLTIPKNQRAGKDIPQNSSKALKNLTPREREILAGIANGLTNNEIAARLHLAEQSIKNRVSILYAKLGIHKRLDAMKIGQSLIEK